MKKETGEKVHPTKEFLEGLKVGDEVIRLLGGTLASKLVVAHIDEKYLYLLPIEDNTNIFAKYLKDWRGGWKILKKTGYEVEERFGWDGVSLSGSYILPLNTQE